MESGIVIMTVTLTLFHLAFIRHLLMKEALPPNLTHCPGTLFEFAQLPENSPCQVPPLHFKSRFSSKTSAPDAICSLLRQAGQAPGMVLLPKGGHNHEGYICH